MEKINESIQLTYCPACGQQTFVVDTEKSYRCQSCQFILYLNPGLAVAAIVEYQDKILLIQRANEPEKGKWDIPGGFVERHENAERALQREIKEETGLELYSFQYLCSFPNIFPYRGLEYHAIDLFYSVCVDDRDVAQLSLGDEASNYSWVSLDEIELENIAFNSTRHALLAYRDVRDAN